METRTRQNASNRAKPKNKDNSKARQVKRALELLQRLELLVAQRLRLEVAGAQVELEEAGVREDLRKAGMLPVGPLRLRPPVTILETSHIGKHPMYLISRQSLYPDAEPGLEWVLARGKVGRSSTLRTSRKSAG